MSMLLIYNISFILKKKICFVFVSFSVTFFFGSLHKVKVVFHVVCVAQLSSYFLSSFSTHCLREPYVFCFRIRIRVSDGGGGGMAHSIQFFSLLFVSQFIYLFCFFDRADNEISGQCIDTSNSRPSKTDSTVIYTYLCMYEHISLIFDYRIDKYKNIRRIAFIDKRNVLSLKGKHG